MDVPILENIRSPIPENVDVPQSQEISIPQFQKNADIQIPKITISLKHNFKKLIFILWIMIWEHANKYENIMLINVMKFDVLTLKIVHTNLL